MKNYIVVIVFFLLSCSQKKKMTDIEVVNYSLDTIDNILIQSDKVHISASKTLKNVDEATEKKVVSVVNKVNEMSKELNTLKSVVKLTKTKEILIHDTIYITEKKNFWGKTKKTIDSSRSITENVDSLQNEN